MLAEIAEKAIPIFGRYSSGNLAITVPLVFIFSLFLVVKVNTAQLPTLPNLKSVNAQPFNGVISTTGWTFATLLLSDN